MKPMKHVNRTEVCEECGDVEPDTDTETGSDWYDTPFGDGGSWEHWKRYYSVCCDADVIMMSNDDIADHVFDELPDLVEFGYNAEDLQACCTVSFEKKHFNLMWHLVTGEEFAVVHPDLLEVHNWRCTAARILYETRFYDWFSDILDVHANYSTDNHTAYRAILNTDKRTLKIYWVL